MISSIAFGRKTSLENARRQYSGRYHHRPPTL